MPRRNTRHFTEADGRTLMEVLHQTRKGILEAKNSSPFNTEIYSVLEEFWQMTRKVAGVLTGDEQCLDAPMGSFGSGGPSKQVTFKTWKTKSQADQFLG